MSRPDILHGGLIARRLKGRWQGALILGPSGSGKSHLALTALSAGWRLVADDRVVVWTDQDRLFGRAPSSLSGLIEVRGLGVMPSPALPLAFCAIDLVVNLLAHSAIERLPAPDEASLGGQIVRSIALDPFSTHSLPMLLMALEHLPVR